MSRSERLLDLIQVLRRHRTPVSGKALADELGISIRTLYRDIVTLQGHGADIEGEPGLGYVLRPGFMLPPLMFSEDEIEVITLGIRWAAVNGDARLGAAANNAAAKIAAVLPADLRRDMETSALLVGSGQKVAGGHIDMTPVRAAIRRERKLRIAYRDKDAMTTQRFIWPFALAFFDKVRVIAAWCELRQGFRHFRIDRIETLEETDIRYSRRRTEMMKAWKAEQGISEKKWMLP